MVLFSLQISATKVGADMNNKNSQKLIIVFIRLIGKIGG